MKKNAQLLLSLLSFGLLFGCQDGGTLSVSSTGRPYEVFVVAPNNLWQGAPGDTLRAIFGQEVEMINQSEPIYDLRNVPPQTGRNKIVTRHRNLMVLLVGTQYPQADMKAEYDIAAKPQLRVTVTAPTADSMAVFLERYKVELVKLFDIAERNRFIARANGLREKEIVELIQQKFGFQMSIPKGYTVRKNADNFLWVSFELPLASVGFSIYTYPADTLHPENNIRPERIIAARNAAVRQIPGPSEGSFMSTSEYVTPDTKLLTAYGQDWIQLRGLWDVTGDFMGGPFINYVTYDRVHRRMLAIDGYVFSPSPQRNYGKRNYIRQVEAIFMTAKLPK